MTSFASLYDKTLAKRVYSSRKEFTHQKLGFVHFGSKILQSQQSGVRNVGQGANKYNSP